MTVYWLTPIINQEPLTFGAGRVALPAVPKVEAFRQKLYDVHPRLLSMVKAGILPSLEEEDKDSSSCGEGTEPEWDNAMDLVWDGSPYTLSTCGMAFLDRLPSAAEQLALLESLNGDEGRTAVWTEEESMWIHLLIEWTRQGMPFLLVRED